jgi:hypothetical protein
MTTQTADAAKQARATVLSMSSDERVTDLEDQQSEAIRLVLSEVGDLAMLCRRMARLLDGHPSKISDQARDYLKRHGFEGSVLRAKGGE